MRYRGLTWDHPRGYNALAAAAARLDEVRDGIAIEWDRQPLEGFEAHPIADLCARYDLVVLDHPHVGEAVAAGCLRPLEALFDDTEIAALETRTIGPCLTSYHYAGRHWALPLDAASQVMACRADLIEGRPPRTWEAVLALAENVPVALSLAGPHAALSFQSIAACLADAPAGPDMFIDEEAGLYALDILASLHARAPAGTAALNPIGLLGHMAQGGTVALCPLIYGYVNYTAPADAGAHPIAFSDAPRATADGRQGSTLGGTGIGVSTRCTVTPALIDHLRWLLGEDAQMRFIPAHDGQPSTRSAWGDATVNARWGNFYQATAQTLESAYIRPRHAGAIAFQTAASALIRDALADRASPRVTLAALQDAYTRSRTPSIER